MKPTVIHSDSDDDFSHRFTSTIDDIEMEEDGGPENPNVRHCRCEFKGCY